MAKFVRDSVMDTGLTAARGNQLLLCAGQPANRAAALAAALASVAIDGSDYSLADGDVSGRKQITAQQVDIPVTVSGTGDHVVTIDSTNVLTVTTCAGTAVTNGGTVTINAFDHEIADAT